MNFSKAMNQSRVRVVSLLCISSNSCCAMPGPIYTIIIYEKIVHKLEIGTLYRYQQETKRQRPNSPGPLADL